MSNPTVTGKVHLIEDTKTFGQRGFRKRLVVLEQDKGKFINYVPVEFVQDACDAVDQINVGDEVKITYRLNGRRWQRDEHSEVKFFLNAESAQFRSHHRRRRRCGIRSRRLRRDRSPRRRRALLTWVRSQGFAALHPGLIWGRPCRDLVRRPPSFPGFAALHPGLIWGRPCRDLVRRPPKFPRVALRFTLG